MEQENLLKRIMIRHCYLFVIAGILSYVTSKLVVVGAELITEAINTLTNGEYVNVGHLINKTSFIIVTAMVVTFLKCIYGELFSIKVQKECKNITIKSLEKTRYSFFEKKSGAVINKLTSDISDMGKLLSEILPEILQYMVTIIIVSVALIKISWIIFAGIMIIFPIAIFLSDIIAKKINELAKKRRGKYDELADIALDNIEGIEVAKAYAIEEILSQRIAIKANEILKNEYSRNRYQAMANALILLIKWVPSIICSVIALWLVLRNTIKVGELMAFLVLFGKISTPLGELPFRIMDAREMLVSVKRINSLICTPKEISGTYAGSNLNDIENVIEMKNVSFTYAGDENVLNDIDMTIKKGEVIAIVGTSGAGKSTLFKLLCGFEQVTSGDYYLCGKHFSEWDIDAARCLISYVPQDSFLFPETILENITHGSKDVNADKVENVCRASGIYKTICELPDKYNTEVGERGVRLSGGERQRISIARALYKNAPILLLDEPTSSLDEKTEKIISRTISENHEKTVIIIAHRLSTIKNVDKIYCMDKGKIVEVGTHEELIRKNKVYASLYGKEVQG